MRILTFIVALAGVAAGFCGHKAVNEKKGELAGALIVFPLTTMWLSWPANMISGLTALLRLVVRKNQELDDAMTHFQHLSTLIGSFGITMWIGAVASAMQGRSVAEPGSE